MRRPFGLEVPSFVCVFPLQGSPIRPLLSVGYKRSETESCLKGSSGGYFLRAEAGGYTHSVSGW